MKLINYIGLIASSSIAISFIPQRYKVIKYQDNIIFV